MMCKDMISYSEVVCPLVLCCFLCLTKLQELITEHGLFYWEICIEPHEFFTIYEKKRDDFSVFTCHLYSFDNIGKPSSLEVKSQKRVLLITSNQGHKTTWIWGRSQSVFFINGSRSDNPMCWIRYHQKNRESRSETRSNANITRLGSMDPKIDILSIGLKTGPRIPKGREFFLKKWGIGPLFLHCIGLTKILV